MNLRKASSFVKIPFWGMIRRHNVMEAHIKRMQLSEQLNWEADHLLRDIDLLT